MPPQAPDLQVWGVCSVHKCCCKPCAAELLGQEAPRCPMCHQRIDAIVLVYDESQGAAPLSDSSGLEEEASASRSSHETSSTDPRSASS